MSKVIELYSIDDVISNFSLNVSGMLTGTDLEVTQLPLSQRSFPKNFWDALKLIFDTVSGIQAEETMPWDIHGI